MVGIRGWAPTGLEVRAILGKFGQHDIEESLD